jgi:phospholipid/cholesterol/gamma-HCH transport system permease protein
VRNADVAQTGDRGQVSVIPRQDSTVVVRLSGTWRLRSGLPSAEAVAGELSLVSPRLVTFDAGKLEGWDSALVAFLARISEVCRERGVHLDRESLPAGVKRLLRLAEAVPEKPGVRRSTSRASWLARVGEAALRWTGANRDSLEFLGEVALSVGRLARGRARFRALDLTVLVQECGAAALPIVTLISVLVGMILAFVGAVQLSRFGAQIYVADLVAIAMVREMGCIMTGIVMAGRTGSGFAAQLGTMKVTQEIDALTTFGILPMDFLVLPRFLALCAMMPLLTVYADVLGILGGGLVSVGMLDLTPAQYARGATLALTLTSCTVGVGKSFVFGALVAIAGCLRGMRCGRSSSAVGDAATSAVVNSIVLIVVADGIFAVIFNVLGI